MAEFLIKKIEEEGFDIRDIIAPPPLERTVEPLAESNAYLPGQVENDEDLLLKTFFKFQKPGADVLESFNNWVQNVLPNQLKNEKSIIMGKDSFAKVTNIKIKKPSIMKDGKEEILWPNEARNKHTYSSAVYISLVKVQIQDGKLVYTDEKKENLFIGKIPTMLGSVICNLHGFDG